MGDSQTSTVKWVTEKGRDSVVHHRRDQRGSAHPRVHAGMGSSAMGASVSSSCKIPDAGFRDITVVNQLSPTSPTTERPVTHRPTMWAHASAPSAALCTVDNFMGSPVYDQIVEHLLSPTVSGSDAVLPRPPAAAAGVEQRWRPATRSATLLATDSIVLDGTAADRDGAISEAGALLLASGASRPAPMSTDARARVGLDPHGQPARHSPRHERQARVASTTPHRFVRYPDGIRWKGVSKFVVSVAGAAMTTWASPPTWRGSSSTRPRWFVSRPPPRPGGPGRPPAGGLTTPGTTSCHSGSTLPPPCPRGTRNLRRVPLDPLVSATLVWYAVRSPGRFKGGFGRAQGRMVSAA